MFTRKLLGVLRNFVKHVHAIQIELGFGACGFWGEGTSVVPRENGRKLTTNLTHTRYPCQEIVQMLCKLFWAIFLHKYTSCYSFLIFTWLPPSTKKETKFLSSQWRKGRKNSFRNPWLFAMCSCSNVHCFSLSFTKLQRSKTERKSLVEKEKLKLNM